jgi:hypothetical protein
VTVASQREIVPRVSPRVVRISDGGLNESHDVIGQEIVTVRLALQPASVGQRPVSLIVLRGDEIVTGLPDQALHIATIELISVVIAQGHKATPFPVPRPFRGTRSLYDIVPKNTR